MVENYSVVATFDGTADDVLRAAGSMEYRRCATCTIRITMVSGNA